MSDELASIPASPVLDLPALTAAKLCHDFIGQVGAIVSGLDLLEDESAQDMREDALALISSSGRKLAAMMEFYRVAYGASSGSETFAAVELERLTRGLFEHMKAELDWRVTPEQLPKAPAKALLGLCQIGGTVLAMGGTVKVRVVAAEGRTALHIDATGRRCRLKPEARAGLQGEGIGEGLPGQWIQAALIHDVIKGAGGRIAIETREAEDSVTLIFACEMPDQTAS